MTVSVNRDVIVIGSSAGGVEAVASLLESIPADIPAALFVVVHVEARHASHLPEVLARKTRLRVRHALHGDRIERGHVLVAPPDNHLIIRAGYVHVVRGPKENNHRPAVDPLFRSAAAVYGNRVIGVVLTGNRDCGTAGFLSIKARGGVTVVQDPRDAFAPEMPASAMAHAAVDHVVPLVAMGPLLERLAHEAPTAQADVSPAIRALEGDEVGAPSSIVCPLCQGSLSETDVEGFSFYRCRVGHSFSLETLRTEQSEEIERALWGAVRALEEGATLAARCAARSGTSGMQERFEEKAATQRLQADRIREVLLAASVRLDIPAESEPRDKPSVEG